VFRGRLRTCGALLALLFVAGTIAAACSSGSTTAQNRAVAQILASSTTTSTRAPVTAAATVPDGPQSDQSTTNDLTTATNQVAVPSVVGQYVTDVRNALTAVGLRITSVNQLCSKGNLTSQSIAVSMGLLGPPSTPVSAGQMVPKRSFIAITWSGCYGKGVVVPNVVGMSWYTGAHTVLAAGGLQRACISQMPYSSTNRTPGNVISQSPAAGTTVATGSTVTLTVDICPADITKAQESH
jgi:beta-lactam-binding protein with PASTA domain